jgi:hypothetical protein
MASDRPGFCTALAFSSFVPPVSWGRFHGRQRAGPARRFSWNVRRGECRDLGMAAADAAKDNLIAGAENMPAPSARANFPMRLPARLIG